MKLPFIHMIVGTLLISSNAYADDWRSMACRDYLGLYRALSSPSSERPDTSLDDMADDLAKDIDGMNHQNLIDAVACECRLGAKRVGDAAVLLFGARRIGLWPSLPVAGTASPAEQRAGKTFEQWIAGNGPHPYLKGHAACDYFRND